MTLPSLILFSLLVGCEAPADLFDLGDMAGLDERR
jgi:hypothetical protein